MKKILALLAVPLCLCGSALAAGPLFQTNVPVSNFAAVWTNTGVNNSAAFADRIEAVQLFAPAPTNGFPASTNTITIIFSDTANATNLFTAKITSTVPGTNSYSAVTYSGVAPVATNSFTQTNGTAAVTNTFTVITGTNAVSNVFTIVSAELNYPVAFIASTSTVFGMLGGVATTQTNTAVFVDPAFAGNTNSFTVAMISPPGCTNPALSKTITTNGDCTIMITNWPAFFFSASPVLSVTTRGVDASNNTAIVKGSEQ